MHYNSIIVVIIVKIIFISSFLLCCLLYNHSFKTNPNSTTNLSKLFNYIAPASLFYTIFQVRSSRGEYKDFVDRELQKCEILFNELGFQGPSSKAAKQLYACFEKLDKDSGGSVSFAEFAEFFRLEKNPFTERCFLLLDRAATGEINFPQFVLCAWNYCSHDRAGLTRFAYTLYDLDNSGNIPIEHLFSLVEDMYDIHGKTSASDGCVFN